MCGRYHLGIKSDKTGKKITERAQELNLVYDLDEIFPTNDVLCIIPRETKIDLSVKKWGIKSKSLIINARIESINDRPTFNEIKYNRCAIICDSFYEWDKDKNKYEISFLEDYMYLACFFNTKDELVILTREAYGEFKKIHNRIPIIMNRDEMLMFVHNEETIISEKKLIIKQLNQDISLF